MEEEIVKDSPKDLARRALVLVSGGGSNHEVMMAQAYAQIAIAKTLTSIIERIDKHEQEEQ